jgi:hypothetical protein
MGEFAPNEVRMFSKKVLVGVRGQSPHTIANKNTTKEKKL